MTTEPTTGVPPSLLTVAEYLAIGEIEVGYSELVEGRFVMSPSPAWSHARAGFRIAAQLEPQLPPEATLAPDIDVDLRLSAPHAPGFVRRPDLVIVRREAGERLEEEGGVLQAADVLVAVEIVSPGSVRTDHVVKRGEYADAGIPHYWIVDLDRPVSLLACHLAGEFGYADDGAVTGTYRATTPFELTLDLTALR